MFDAESNVTGAIVVAGENLTVSATVVDIENNERLNNATGIFTLIGEVPATTVEHFHHWHGWDS